MFLTLLQSGGAGPGVITGTLSAVESGADTLSAEGVVRIAGELAATETGADTFAATGTATNAITGSLAAVETGADTLSATGIVLVQGALAAIETGIDTFAASGVAGGGSTDQPSYWSDRPWRDVPFIAIAPRRPRRKRQEDLIFLGR
jgi:hypothetical protein